MYCWLQHTRHHSFTQDDLEAKEYNVGLNLTPPTILNIHTQLDASGTISVLITWISPAVSQGRPLPIPICPSVLPLHAGWISTLKSGEKDTEEGPQRLHLIQKDITLW